MHSEPEVGFMKVRGQGSELVMIRFNSFSRFIFKCVQLETRAKGAEFNLIVWMFGSSGRIPGPGHDHERCTRGMGWTGSAFGNVRF